jgi:hypothetical protein
MSILCSTKTISIILIILPVNHLDISVFNVLSIHNRHFLPFRRAVLYNRVGWEALRCKGFAVDNYSYILCASHPLMLGWGGLASTRE